MYIHTWCVPVLLGVCVTDCVRVSKSMRRCWASAYELTMARAWSSWLRVSLSWGPHKCQKRPNVEGEETWWRGKRDLLSWHTWAMTDKCTDSALSRITCFHRLITSRMKKRSHARSMRAKIQRQFARVVYLRVFAYAYVCACVWCGVCVSEWLCVYVWMCVCVCMYVYTYILRPN